MELEHQTVLLREAVDALQVVPSGCYVDATFGRGGHSREILARLGPDGRLLAIDRDPEAVAAGQLLAKSDARFTMRHAEFSALASVVDSCGWRERVSGVLMDIGVSSPQLDDPARGFSFMRDGPLDMRMNPQEGRPAAEYIASASAEELQTVFSELGEERYSRRIAQAIVRARAVQPLTTTRELADIVAAAVPSRDPGRHPATRVFQALRIHVNRELEQLVDALTQVLDLLTPGGRIVVITFHSLEDRIVKRFFSHHARGPDLPRHMPIPAGAAAPRIAWVGKAVRPADAEVALNPRARSATLRVAAVGAGGGDG
ncbi:MAG: 16S rRNA (cytosine(1402)-N(4))-methyltransferase RsmH [Gammaproteobacteria bacterium]